MKSDFHQRLIEVTNNPIEYHDNNYQKLTYDNSLDSIENLIFLLFCSKTKIPYNKIQQMKEQIISHPDYMTNLEYQYFTNLACADIHRDMANFDDAISYFNHLLEIATLMDERDKILTAFTGMATVYNEIYQGDKALEYIEKSISILSQTDDPMLAARTFYTYAAILLQREEYYKGIQAAENALVNFNDVDDGEDQLPYTMTNIMLVRMLYLTGQEERANKIMSQIIPNAERHNHLDGLQNMQKTIATYYEEVGEYKKALKHQKIYSKVLEKREKDRITSFRPTGSKQIDSLKSLLDKNESLQQRITELYKLLPNNREDFTTLNISFEEIQDALKNSEFDIYFQLIWSDREHRYVKAEALMRWIKPDGSIISPDHFVTYLEESELSSDFLQLLINRSLEFIQKINTEEEADLTVCLNISPYQLREINIISLLESACIRNQINPSNVELEITERMVLEKDVTVFDRIFKLKERGFKLSMDDFGTGFSSLECLRTLNLDTVKLDRSLINDVHGNERAVKLLRGIIHLLTDLKYQIVCEGVELEEDVKLLTSLGCYLHQGYFYNRPSSMDEVVKKI